MRVLLDANVWISYLLAPDSARTVTRAVELCFAPSVTLIFPVELQIEIRNSVQNSSYLQRRIPEEVLGELIQTVQAIAEVPPPLTVSPDAVSRDVGDDYLIAYGLLNAVDYLVTGDNDLLVLAEIDSLSIVTPAAFVGRHRTG